MKAFLCVAPILGAALAASSGDFTVLSMNVAGLPAILNSNDVPGDKTTNAKLIGSFFAQHNYSLIHAQEDFNYHAAIYSTDTHPFRTATSGGVPFGSGLNTLSNHPWLDFRRVKWDTCSDASSSDCLTPKGFTFMRLALSTSSTVSTYIDVYNLHADAGTLDADNTARQHNINQVASYISTWSAGNPVLVLGDFNSRYSRTADTAIRALLSSPSTSLSDPWLLLARGTAVPPTAESLCANPSATNYCETVDKVFFRSSPLLTLTPTAYEYVGGRFLQPSGDVLSDHNPVLVNFTYAAGVSLQQSNLHGGPHGNWFSDVPVLSGVRAGVKVIAITLRGGSRVDSVGVTLSEGTVLRHGGSGGTAVTLTLGVGEFWTEGEMCQAQKGGRTRVFYIGGRTSSGKEVQAGTKTGECVVYSAPRGWQILGFLGQDGDEIDQLGFVYGKQ
ncbi:endonuclease exonuclease phosphatase family protein [Cercophora newfieldiana]|uniref:Endonuclease exonuclease phosphatase family protein n=1 Tax=Cercophora newfieldiana TaxID=92897 RepID=A0AA39XSS1_9PEZI|nr:endonuclease exonuclease phosphatase family protein [Cercophora newfieldiana]